MTFTGFTCFQEDFTSLGELKVDNILHDKSCNSNTHISFSEIGNISDGFYEQAGGLSI